MTYYVIFNLAVIPERKTRSYFGLPVTQLVYQLAIG